MAFNPGPLTAQHIEGKPDIQGYASHAEFEQECKRCHQPLKSNQAPLCLDCHQSIVTEIETSTGVHAGNTNVTSCRFCHPDHKGRGFSPAAAASKYYKHENIGFDLINHQVNYDTSPMKCGECHVDYLQGNYHMDQSACESCHQNHDADFMHQHQVDYGVSACLDCHDGVDRLADFNHEASQFPLTGKHINLSCTTCHLGPDTLPRFVGVSAACAACHPEPDLHRGFFSDPCETCHTVDGWTPVMLEGALFDHAVQGKFSLALHKNQPEVNLACKDCHITDLNSPTDPVCLDCHSKSNAEFMASHLQQFGTACVNCHDGIDRYSNFDHNQFFVLDGPHSELECASCHGLDSSTAVYNSLGKECVNCHAEPDIHAGTFGTACQDCHSTTAWSPAALRIHNFPLDHGEQGQVPCATCHTIRYTEYTCFTCHEHNEAEIAAEHAEENISLAELPDCMKCHPTGREE